MIFKAAPERVLEAGARQCGGALGGIEETSDGSWGAGTLPSC